MFLEVAMTNLILMVALKYFRNSNVYSQYDPISFIPHIGNIIYKSEKSGYNRHRLYVEETGEYILMAKKDGYLYTWQKKEKE
jgi:hypothetical protein